MAKNAAIYFWICAVITSASAATSAAFSIAALVSSGDAPTNARYAVSRSITLLVIAILVVAVRSRTGLLTIAAVMVLVQAGDALIGGGNHDRVKTLGPAVTAAINAGAVMLLLAMSRMDRRTRKHVGRGKTGSV